MHTRARPRVGAWVCAVQSVCRGDERVGIDRARRRRGLTPTRSVGHAGADRAYPIDRSVRARARPPDRHRPAAHGRRVGEPADAGDGDVPADRRPAVAGRPVPAHPRTRPGAERLRRLRRGHGGRAEARRRRGDHRVVRGSAARRPRAGAGAVAAHVLHHRRRAGAGRLRAPDARGDGDRAGPRTGDGAGRDRPARRDRRRGCLRDRRGRAAAAGGDRVHDPGAPRRRRRRLARERLPGRRRRHPELPVLVLVRRPRLVHPLRQARRDDHLPARRRHPLRPATSTSSSASR